MPRLTLLFLLYFLANTAYIYAQKQVYFLDTLPTSVRIRAEGDDGTRQTVFEVARAKNTVFAELSDGKLSTQMHLGSFKVRQNMAHAVPYALHSITRIPNGLRLNLKALHDTQNKGTATQNLYFTLANNGNFYIERAKNNALSMKTARYQSPYSRLTLRMRLPKGEYFYGGGTQFTHFQLNGHTVPFWIQEQGIGRGDFPVTALANLQGAGGNAFTTFSPVPFVTSNRGRAFSLATNIYNTLIFRSEEVVVQQWLLSACPSQLLFNLKTANCTAEQHPNSIALNGFVLGTNRASSVPPPDTLPSWTLHTIVGLQGGTEEVLRKINAIEAAGTHLQAVWIQDWCGQRVTPFGKQVVWNWQLDTTRYHHFAAFRNSLQQRGIRLMGYVNPFLAEGTPLADTAIRRHFVVLDAAEKPYRLRATGFNAYLINLRDTAAQSFIQNIIQQNLIQNGFDGWMADFGEWMPTDISKPQLQHDFAQRNPRTDSISPLFPATVEGAHTEFANVWQTVQQEAVKKAAQHHRNVVYFMRANTTIGGAPFYWTGDQNVTWGKRDGLPSVVPALLSSAMSGMRINHSDAGGFTSFRVGPFRMARTRELLYRWLELAAFTPIFRTHESIQPDINLQIYSDTAAARFFARCSAWHERLFPLFRQLSNEAAIQFRPVVRPMVLNYPLDPATPALDRQFMLGTRILVLPVLQRGVKTVRGYFPKGQWQHFLTHTIIHSKGEWRRVPAPVGTPAVYELLNEEK